MKTDKLKAATGLSLTGLFVLFALHGEAFWKGALGFWTFLVTITTTAPAGLASFFIALGLSTMLVIALKRGVPVWDNAHARGFLIETMAGVAAMVVAWLQMPYRNGLIVGAFAGFMSPYLAKAILGGAQYLRSLWHHPPSP